MRVGTRRIHSGKAHTSSPRFSLVSSPFSRRLYRLTSTSAAEVCFETCVDGYCKVYFVALPLEQHRKGNRKGIERHLWVGRYRNHDTGWEIWQYKLYGVLYHHGEFAGIRHCAMRSTPRLPAPARRACCEKCADQLVARLTRHINWIFFFLKKCADDYYEVRFSEQHRKGSWKAYRNVPGRREIKANKA